MLLGVMLWLLKTINKQINDYKLWVKNKQQKQQQQKTTTTHSVAA
jgi:hypothetical protein